MNVLLISANCLHAPYPVYPLGLDYVAAAIASRHHVKIADLNLMPGGEGIASVLQSFRPEVVGISLRNIDNTDGSDPQEFVAEYRRLVRTIRRHSKAAIVLGGSGFTLFPQELMAVLEADFGIVGEGERLARLLEALEKGEPPPTGDGLVDPSGPFEIPAPWPRTFPHSADVSYAHRGYYLSRGGMMNLQTQRGCPFRCIYCTYPLIEGARVRPVPPQEVAATALNLQKIGARYLWITDSTFNADPAHALEVAEALHAAGVSIPWGAFLSPVSPSEGFYARLARAGMTHVEFGTDSLAGPVLEAYRKPFGVRDVFAAHQAAVDAGFNVAHYLLLGGPGETPETLEESLSNIDKLRKTVLFFFCGIRVYPRTALYSIALADECIGKNTSLLPPVFYQSPAIGAEVIIRKVKQRAAGRVNWVVGSGGQTTERIVARMFEKGYSGPLWEFLVR